MEKIALITGGSKGIGRALADEFAKNGYSLILVSRGQEALQTAQEQLQNKYPCEVKILSADIGTPEGVKALMTSFKDELKNVDVLVNNAGFSLTGKFTDIPLNVVNDMIALNITALTDMTYQFLQLFLAQKKGMILNVASTAAFGPGPYMAVYYATKAYVLSLSTALAEEYAKSGIVISTLCPGPTETEFFTTAKMLKTKIANMKSKMTAEQVAKAGYTGLMKKKRLIVPGLMNKMSVWSMKMSPNWVVAKITAAFDRIPEE